MKRLIAFFILLSTLGLFAQTNLPIGTIRKPIMTDASGTVISTNITFTNQVTITLAPALSNNLVRLTDLTNNVSVVKSVTNSTSLIGPYTITVNSKIITFSTNGSSLFFTGAVTNIGPGLGSSNIVVYQLGIVTNKFTIP